LGAPFFTASRLEKSVKIVDNCLSPFCRQKETEMVCCDSCRDFEVCDAKANNKPCCSYCEQYDVCCELEDRVELLIELENTIDG